VRSLRPKPVRSAQGYLNVRIAGKPDMDFTVILDSDLLYDPANQRTQGVS
jgi:hypothetical protein